MATATVLVLSIVAAGSAAGQPQQREAGAAPVNLQPQPQDPQAQAFAAAQHKLRGLTLEQKVGQLFVADVWGKSASETHPKNQTKYGVGTPAEVVQRYQVGGVIYFNNAGTDNVDDPLQLARFSNGLQRAKLRSGAPIPLSISIDQEGGRVTRIGDQATEYPSSMAVGAGRGVDDAKRLATVNGHELRAMGIDQNFAPVADVNSNPLNPVIGTRSFSADPALAGQLVTAETEGYQRSGWPTETVSSSAKHFPGHGDAKDDSHVGLPVINRTEAEWRRIDLPPFKAAIDAGVDSIMTAHISVPSLEPADEPATLSKRIMTGILREELGYRGVIVTDSLQMQGVRDRHPDAEIPVLALEAGVDQMLMPPNLRTAIDGVLTAVRSGRVSEQRIDESVLRILKMKFLRGLFFAPFADEARVASKVGTPEHRDTIQQITDKATTLLRDDAKTLPLAKSGKVLVTGWHNPNYPGYPAEPVTALAGQLNQRGSTATALSTGARPDDATIARAVAAAQQSDVTVVLTNGLKDSAQQNTLVAQLRATGKPVVLVGVQEPYDPGYVPDAPTWLVTYDWRTVSMTTLAKVLLGEQAPRGKLPAAVPYGNDPARVLFPFGHGLSW